MQTYKYTKLQTAAQNQNPKLSNNEFASGSVNVVGGGFAFVFSFSPSFSFCPLSPDTGRGTGKSATTKLLLLLNIPLKSTPPSPNTPSTSLAAFGSGGPFRNSQCLMRSSARRSQPMRSYRRAVRRMKDHSVRGGICEAPRRVWRVRARRWV